MNCTDYKVYKIDNSAVKCKEYYVFATHFGKNELEDEYSIIPT